MTVRPKSASPRPVTAARPRPCTEGPGSPGGADRGCCEEAAPSTFQRPGLTLSGVSLATPQRTQATHVTWRLRFMVLSSRTPRATDSPLAALGPRRLPDGTLREQAPGAACAQRTRGLGFLRPLLTSLQGAKRERGGERVEAEAAGRGLHLGVSRCVE